jgi:hypothetical protein
MKKLNRADMFFKALNNARKYRIKGAKNASLLYLTFAEEVRITDDLKL